MPATRPMSDFKENLSLETVLDSLRDDALILLDPEGRVRLWSQGARRLFGFEAGEMEGRPAADLNRAGEQGPIRIAQEAPPGHAADAEGWLRGRDGADFRALVSVSPLRDPAGAILGHALFVKDISLRHQSDEFLHLSFEAAPNGILLVHGDGTISMVNAAAETLFGMSRDELVGRAVETLVPERYRARHPGYRASFASDPRSRPMGAGRDLYALRKDGSEFPVEIGLNPVQTERGLMTLTTVVDITERKRAEQQLHELNDSLEQRITERTRVAEQRAQQLRALAAELTQAEHRERLRLAQMLHDHIQQLLVAARLKLSALTRFIQGEHGIRLSKELQSLLNETVESSRSLAADLSPPILRDAGLVRALEWLARRYKEQHELDVRVKAAPEDEPRSEEIRFLLFEAIRELLFNVVKHAKVDRAEVRLSRRNGNVDVLVEDAGAGFDLATQIPSSSAGFGLLHVRERLEMMGGSLGVQSSPGSGTRVLLSLPDQIPPVRSLTGAIGPWGPAQSPLSEGAVASRIRVLIADDHHIVREGLVGVLEAASGIVVVGEAANGAEAVERATILRPDVVIMDINMPILNGIEATRHIKRTFPNIAVIGLSLHSERDMALSMKEAGAAAYLSKDAPSEDLLRAIRATRSS